MKLNNKGFAVAGVLYILLLLFLIMITTLLARYISRRTLLDKVEEKAKKSEIVLIENVPIINNGMGINLLAIKNSLEVNPVVNDFICSTEEDTPQQISNESTLDDGDYLLICNWTDNGTLKTKKINLTVYKDKEYIFNETKPYEEFTAPITGKYILEVWGASGGDALCNGNLDNCETISHVNAEGGYGGKGGYSKGIIELTKGDKLYVYLGQKGADGQEGINSPASWNGGGSATFDGVVNEYGGGESAGAGGGATDIRTINSATWNDSVSLASRIIVAGGGGGASFVYSGGAGGGVEGGLTQGTWTEKATQTSGHLFGIGSNGTGFGDSDGVAGGGGGYWGGISKDNTTYQTAGGGGSGYVDSKLTDADTIIGTSSFLSPTGSSETGHNGDGYAKITYLK